MTDVIFDKLISLFGSLEPVIIILAALPIAEVRLAIPIAIKYGMSPLKAFLLAFCGSTVVTAILLAALLPFIRFLSRKKVFKKLADTVLKKAHSGAEKITRKKTDLADKAPDIPLLRGGRVADGVETLNNKNKPLNNKAETLNNKTGDLKRMLGIGSFVAVPLPLTGVWSGSLIAGILELKYFKSLLSIAAGNLIASAIITVASVFFAEYINTMVAVFAVIALAAVVLLLIKAFIGGKKTE